MGLVTNPKQLCLTSFESDNRLKFYHLLRSHHVRSDLEDDERGAKSCFQGSLEMLSFCRICNNTYMYVCM